MKRILITISVFFYLVMATGLIINTHYCMNSVSSVHLFESETKLCNQCGMETHESDGCCRDEVKMVKLLQDQNNVSSIVFEFSSISAPVVLPSVYLALSTYNIDENRHFENHSPPLLSAQDTYLQINVFRI